jgi:predicted ArsR family transcriptional regulator
MLEQDITKNRHGGNEQSNEAFQKIESSLPDRRAGVLILIRNAASEGLTVHEAAELLGTTPNAVSGRFSELKKGGLIEQIGRRATPTGCSAGVYRVKQPQGDFWFDGFQELYAGNPYER